jgi:hypothetical protein
MQQRMRRFAFFVGGSILMAAGIFAAACGTDNGGGSSGALPTPDSSKTDTGGNPATDSGGTDSGGDTGGGDADCSKAASLHSSMDGGSFYCPFRSADGGNAGPCTQDETCCNPSGKLADGGFLGSFCATSPAASKGTGNPEDVCAAQAVAAGSSWGDGGSAWECFDKNNCAPGKVCCLTGTGVNIGKTTNTSIPPACNAKQAFKFEGTKCETQCAAGEIKLCSLSDQNCGAGTTCTPFLALSRDLAACQ